MRGVGAKELEIYCYIGAVKSYCPFTLQIQFFHCVMCVHSLRACSVHAMGAQVQLTTVLLVCATPGHCVQMTACSQLSPNDRITELQTIFLMCRPSGHSMQIVACSQERQNTTY